MLEKIGLPAKPSMRGASWVIDASHCQGCSSQFTMFNRKHHCRRCGGIFCNSCSQQRMVLRGQGDSPVRICDPCKKLEEAARFELRYGHKSRVNKGHSKQVLKTDDDLLDEISGAVDGKHLTSLRKESHVLSDSPSSSAVPDNTGLSDGLVDSECSSPEDLRRQATEEKRRYKILKAEGKTEEALKAFKLGKELERQASALDISMRKSRKMPGKVSNIGGSEKKMISSGDSKAEVKDDLFSELRQLGWSDADLHDSDKKPSKPSLEGELSTLIGESVQKKGGIDKTQVIALKRKAVLLKREGKLAEAKEELKQAKKLEKQLEEQEVLGNDSASDDELYNLIRNMGGIENQDDLVLEHNTQFDHLISIGDDLPIDDNLEVTEDDMNDPEIGNALKLFGWSEEDEQEQSYEELNQKRAGNATETMSLLKKAKVLKQGLESIQPPPSRQIIVPKSKLQIQRELLALKKKALTLRREGRIEDANEELRKGQSLEQQLEELENASKKPVTMMNSVDLTVAQDTDFRDLDLRLDDVETDVTELDMHDPNMLSALRNLGWVADESNTAFTTPSEISSKSVRSKVEIQRDLLAIKRKALSLRRQGKIEEAEEELERAKNLENLLADDQSKPLESISKGDDNEHVSLKHEKSSNITAISNDSKEEIISFKRKALALKREGKMIEAKEELWKAKLLEKNLEGGQESSIDDKSAIVSNNIERNSESLESIRPHSPKPISSRDRFKLQQESLAHKRNALKLRREGKIHEAEAELEKAKELEIRLEECSSQASNSVSAVDTEAAEDRLDPQIISALKSIGWDDKDLASNGRDKPQSSSSKERVSNQSGLDKSRLEEQIKAAKFRALTLKRAGKQDEALEALRESKKLEKKLESMI